MLPFNTSRRKSKPEKDAKHKSPSSFWLLNVDTTQSHGDEPIISSSGQTTWRTKIGWYGLLVFIVGTFAILLALAFITFLWKGVNARSSWNGSRLTSLWRHIIISGWLTRSVTLSAFVIRWSLTAQGGVLTSMLAAYWLENLPVPTSEAPEVAVVRSSNAGPHVLALKLSRGYTFRKAAFFSLILVLTSTTLLSQFGSTVLLSDIADEMIVSRPSTSAMPYTLKFQAWGFEKLNGFDYWTTKPVSYPIFAEYSQPPQKFDKLIDTGTTIRAYLPLTQPNDRNRLHSYSGEAVMSDLRTVCVRPSISGHVQYDTVTGASWLEGRVSGNIPPDLSKNLRGQVLDNIDGMALRCVVPVMLSRSEPNTTASSAYNLPRLNVEWPTTMCKLAPPEPDPEIQKDAGLWTRYPILILNTTHGEHQETSSLINGSSIIRNGDLDPTSESDRNDSWLDFHTQDGKISVTASLCWTVSISYESQVHMTSTEKREEPELLFNRTRQEYNGRQIRKQLAVHKSQQSSPLPDRPVMSLIPNATWLSKNITMAERPERIQVDKNFNVANRSAEMCIFCHITTNYSAPETRILVHKDLVAVFQDILKFTRNPAMALQAHYHLLLQMAYYDSLLEADDTTNATLDFFNSVLMPVRWNGYIACVVVLLVHFVCGIIAMSLFFSHVKLCQIGNSWQAIAQSGTGETAEYISSAHAVTDKEIRRRLNGSRRDPNKQSMRKRNQVMLTEFPDGRIGFTRVGDTGLDKNHTDEERLASISTLVNTSHQTPVSADKDFKYEVYPSKAVWVNEIPRKETIS